MSWVGMPSLMQTMVEMPAAAASRTASAQKAAGTKISEQLALASSTASWTVLNTGTLSSKVSPPRPGVTPATTLVPYSMQRRVWKLPSRPVMP